MRLIETDELRTIFFVPLQMQMGCLQSSPISIVRDSPMLGAPEGGRVDVARNRYAVSSEPDGGQTTPGTAGNDNALGKDSSDEEHLTNIGDFNVERGGRMRGKRGRSRDAGEDEDMDDAMKRLKEKVRKESERRKRRASGTSRDVINAQMRSNQRNIIMNEIKSETPFSATIREGDAAGTLT